MPWGGQRVVEEVVADAAPPGTERCPRNAASRDGGFVHRHAQLTQVAGVLAVFRHQFHLLIGLVDQPDPGEAEAAVHHRDAACGLEQFFAAGAADNHLVGLGQGLVEILLPRQGQFGPLALRDVAADAVIAVEPPLLIVCPLHPDKLDTLQFVVISVELARAALRVEHDAFLLCFLEFFVALGGTEHRHLVERFDACDVHL